MASVFVGGAEVDRYRDLAAWTGVDRVDDVLILRSAAGGRRACGGSHIRGLAMRKGISILPVAQGLIDSRERSAAVQALSSIGY